MQYTHDEHQNLSDSKFEKNETQNKYNYLIQLGRKDITFNSRKI